MFGGKQLRVPEIDHRQSVGREVVLSLGTGFLWSIQAQLVKNDWADHSSIGCLVCSSVHKLLSEDTLIKPMSKIPSNHPTLLRET